MPRFSINVSIMLHEYAFLDRFAAAADLGFAGVDIQFPYDHGPEEVAARARAAGVEPVLLNLPAGDRAAGELGIAGLPGRETEFRAGVGQALRYCLALDCRRVNALAGLQPSGESVERCRAVMVENLAYAAEFFRREGITVMVEPANGRDNPGFLIQATEDALSVMDAAGQANLMLQFDLYHRQITQGDLIPALERFLPRIAHIQFADTPGRHEPGSGEINFPRVFEAIDALGYGDWVGAEYLPRGPTGESLAWFAPWRGSGPVSNKREST
jgi:hydroxypyruvate isomerase